ncbi:MAG: L-threonine 3-dehydrogenase [Bacteroidales bacterium]|nr:L-threonine 3-dehydrogenase [Bacteroidales bacterium]
MKKILITGSGGQIGSELTGELRSRYGAANVIATDKRSLTGPLVESGPYEMLDVLDTKMLGDLIRKYKIDTIYHLAAILSAVGEEKPQLAWNIGINGLYNVLEAAREHHCAVFFPSSIGAFGLTTPRNNTPQDTIQRPVTMYGVTKVTGELLCDYYHIRFGVDTRGVRFPGIISSLTKPGGGTTDYAVEIYYAAVQEQQYTCPLPAGTFLDMMYMPDAIHAAIQLMEADPSKLKHRNSFNITAMSFDPEMIAAEIRKHIPDFKMDYRPDPVKVAIANSWPDRMDDSAARTEWGWDPEYDLERMTEEMLSTLQVRE